MLGHRELTIEDYVAILKRRFWLILVSAVALLALSVGISFILPSQYESKTLVIIQQQKVPQDYVKPVVNEDLNARLASMREQVLSRSRLEPIINQRSLFAGGGNTMDDRVDLTRKAVAIEPIPSSSQAHGMPGFIISFKAQDAHAAQLVCGDITSLLVTENVTSREQSAVGTTDFLKQQLADAKRNLDDQDAKLAAFQQKYIGLLPDQQGANIGTLQAVTSQLDAATQALSRMQQDETFLETVVSEQTLELQRAEPSSGVSVDTLQTQLQALIAEKSDLEARYTPDYPDVVSLSRKIADLQDKIAKAASHPAPAAAAVSRPDPPQLQQTKAQLRALRQSIADKKHDQTALEKQLRTYQSRIEARPQVEEEYKQITRDHDTALQFYNSLLKKLNDSNMASSLEQHQEGEQFQVLDAPNLPDAPTFPNPYIFAGGGFVGGLFLGMLIAAWLEYRDTSLRNERDVWAFTKLATLATISHIEELDSVNAKSKRGKLFPKTSRPDESLSG